MKKEIDEHTLGYLVDHFPSLSETFIINQMVSVIERGVSIRVIARKIQSLKKSSQANLIEKHHLLRNAESYLPRIPGKRLNKIFYSIFLILKSPFLINIFFKTLNFKKYGTKGSSLKLWFHAVRFYQYKRIGFFHAHFGINGMHIADMQELGVTKAIFGVTFHGYDAHPTESYNFQKLKENYKKMFQRAAFICVNTGYLKQKVLELGCPVNKIHTIPMGIDTNFFSYKERIKSKTVKLISVGRLIPLKGYKYAVRAVKELIDKGYEIDYTIVGEGPDFESLEKLVTQLDLEHVVTFTKGKNQKEILTLLHENDIFLMPSVTDINGRAEAQGLVTIEAQATGLPVVAFSSGGVPDTVDNEKTGFLIPEKNYFLMAEKLAFFIVNPEERKIFGKKSREFVLRNFDQKKLGEKMIKLYKNFYEFT